MVKSTRGLELPVILSIYRKPAGKPPWQKRQLKSSRVEFPEVSGQSVIDGPHGSLKVPFISALGIVSSET